MSSTFIPKYQKQSKAGINTEIKQTLKYFKNFFYAPTLEEVWQFLPVQIEFRKFKIIIEKLVEKKEAYTKNNRLVLPVNKELIKKSIEKQKISAGKWQLLKGYKPLLNRIPFIQFIGVSGSLAMGNAEKWHDIDLFVISFKNRLFLARLFITLLTKIFGIRRSRGVAQAPDKLCLNLFFDESSLTVPKKKQSYFTAHEVLQLYPLINRKNTWERFIQENSWVKKYFPNCKTEFRIGNDLSAKVKKETNNNIPIFIFDVLEVLAKRIQLILINKHRTNETITNKQLWFFPTDV
jgi:hypothetical protein